MLLLLLWLCLVVALVIAATHFVISREHHRFASGLLALMIATPPVVIFLVVNIFLLNGHPTAQFNAYSPSGMEWWSWWVHWFEVFATIVFVQIGVYALMALACSIFKPWRRFLFTLVFAEACALMSLYILALASPSA